MYLLHLLGKGEDSKLANISLKYYCFKNLCEGSMPLTASKIYINEGKN